MMTINSRGAGFALAVLLVQHAATGYQTTVDLGTNSCFAVLAGSGITVAGAVHSTTITGNIGTFPTPTIAGLENIVLHGTNHADDAVTQAAQNDLSTAITNVAARTPVTRVATELGGTTNYSGVHDSADGTFGLTGILTLDAQGDSHAVFIFKATTTLITAVGSAVRLVGGAQSKNIFWVVGSSATLGAASTFKGSLLAKVSITLTTGASLEGRLLARDGAVTLDNNAIAIPDLDPPLRFTAITRIPDGSVILVLTNLPGLAITLQYVPVLPSSNWLFLSTETPGVCPYVVTDTTASAVSARFYRAFYP